MKKENEAVTLAEAVDERGEAMGASEIVAVELEVEEEVALKVAELVAVALDVEVRETEEETEDVSGAHARREANKKKIMRDELIRGSTRAHVTE